ncbi:O-antigen ligase family protein [Vibrio cholerae]
MIILVWLNFNGGYLMSNFSFNQYPKKHFDIKSLVMRIPLFVILFAPAASFGVFYSIVFVMLMPFVFFGTRFYAKVPTLIFVYIFLFYLSFSLAKAIYFDSLADVKEMVKVFCFLVVFLSVQDKTFSYFHNLLILYLAIDFSISLMQFTHFSNYFTLIVSDLYNSKSHSEFSFSLSSVRALGLSPGPGQHGVLAVFSFAFFIIRANYSNRTASSYIGILLSFAIVALAQSKTAILVLLILMFIFFFLVIITKRFTYVFMVTICFFALFCFVFAYWDVLINTFYDLKRLTELGLQVSSMSARVDIWIAQISAVINSNFFLILFGAGRSFLDNIDIYNNSFDSDYVYIFVVYGFFGVLALLILMFYIFKNLIVFSKISDVAKIVTFVFVSGFITSFSLDFFFDVKILTLLAYLLRVALNILNEENAVRGGLRFKP